MVSEYQPIVHRLSRRPSGLRKTRRESNSLAHRTTWLRSDLYSSSVLRHTSNSVHILSFCVIPFLITLFGGIGKVGRPSGLRKTRRESNSLAHRTTWLRSDFSTLHPRFKNIRICLYIHPQCLDTHPIVCTSYPSASSHF